MLHFQYFLDVKLSTMIPMKAKHAPTKINKFKTTNKMPICVSLPCNISQTCFIISLISCTIKTCPVSQVRWWYRQSDRLIRRQCRIRREKVRVCRSVRRLAVTGEILGIVWKAIGLLINYSFTLCSVTCSDRV